MAGDSRVMRVDKVLGALEAEHVRGSEFVRLVDLAAAADLPVSTTYRLLSELCSSRFVERHDNGYRLGSRLFELGERALPMRKLRDTALPFLADFSRSTDSAMHLGILCDTEVLIVARMAGLRHQRISVSIGDRLPARSHAIGMAILAHADPRTIVGPVNLWKALSEIRRSGYAVDRSGSSGSVGCLAMPIRAGGAAVAAVSCSMESYRMRPELLAPAMHSVVVAISRSLIQP